MRILNTQTDLFLNNACYIDGVLLDFSKPLLDRIHNYYNNVLSSIINECSSKNGDGGKIRTVKNPIPARIFQFMIDDILYNLDIKSERIKLSIDIFKDGERVSIDPFFDDVYLNKLSNTVRQFVLDNKDKSSTGVYVDGVLKVDNCPIIISEHKAQIDVTMLRRALQDFELVYDTYPNASYVLFALENDIGADYHEDKPQKDICGSMIVHALLSRYPFWVEIFILLDGHRASSKPIHELGHFKPLSDYKMIRTYNKLREIIIDRLNFYGLVYKQN